MGLGETDSQAKESETETGFFEPRDAQGIGDLFRAVYGEEYPIKVFYDPEALTKANGTGEYYSVVARTSQGKVVGVQHIFRSAPYQGTYEVGSGMVLKEYRTLGLNKKLLWYVFDRMPVLRPGIEEMFGEPVCNHTHMQKAVEPFGFVETAMEVALMPAAAYDVEKSASGRVAALLAFRCYKPHRHKVYLPRCYEEELRFIYSALDDERYLAPAADHPPAEEPSASEMTVFDFAQVARIAIHNAGTDFSRHMDEREDQAANRGVVVIQVWLKLTAPWVEIAVDVLRRKGYFLGGVLPRWFGDDGFLMQKLHVEPDFEEIKLHSDRARRILKIVSEDWRRAAGQA